MKKATCISSSLVLVALLFSGCDFADRRVTDGERADRMYRAAMAEYAAGRLDASIVEFEKVLKSNPGNASARFQLACLLQDHRKDPLGAICNYREYKALFPAGDKVKIADERTDACERQLAVLLVKKYNLGGSVAQDETNARLRSDKAKLESELDETRKSVEKLQSELSALRRENERVRRMVLSEADDDGVGGKAAVGHAVAERQDAGKKMPAIPDEDALLEDEDVGMDRVKLSADIDSLIAEEKDETRQAAPFGKTVRKPREPSKEVSQEPPHEPRPATYVVQEGDTLFKLAVRFYGRRSAWVGIRDANKATVSPDGRIRAGQKLVLP